MCQCLQRLADPALTLLAYLRELGRKSDAVVVPREALVDTGERQYVFVASGGGRFEPRLVRAGGGDGGHVAILEGLADGEAVVTTAAFLLDSESRLRAALAPAPPSPR